MKRSRKPVSPPERVDENASVDMDCSCQILYDDCLSNVGDSDCDCSECLEANLNAFNQLKIQNQYTLNSTKQIPPKVLNPTSRSALKVKNENNRGRQSNATIQRFKSSERIPNRQKNTSKPRYKIQNEQTGRNDFDEFLEGGQFSNGQLNDFLLVTQHRTRKYLEDRKRLEQSQNLKKAELKDKIKRNLEMLKYTASIMPKTNEAKSQQLHPFKWNHSKYKCECNGQTNSLQANQNCCRKSCRKLKIKQGLDTNLASLKPSFELKREQFLNQAKSKREQILQAQKHQICPDKCPNHHNRTDKQKIKKIQQFINKNVEKHKKKLKKMKRQEQEKKRAIQGKLTAIDIKSKQILKRSKKYDENVSITSFKDSIEQYDTFSQLRQENERRKKIKQDRKDVKNNPKIKEELLEKVYEDAEEEWELDRAKNNDKSEYRTKGEMAGLRQGQQMYERIAYDAGITAPKNIKHGAEETSKQNKKSQKELTAKGRAKQITNLNKIRQEEQKKRIQQEIAKKKKEIVEQFKKRNSNAPQNRKIRQSYQEKLEVSKNNNKKAEQPGQQPASKDPYRKNYQTKAGKNSDQIRAHGDPLIQEYTYHQEKGRSAKSGNDMEIFSSNMKSLSSKKKLVP